MKRTLNLALIAASLGGLLACKPDSKPVDQTEADTQFLPVAVGAAYGVGISAEVAAAAFAAGGIYVLDCLGKLDSLIAFLMRRVAIFDFPSAVNHGISRVEIQQRFRTVCNASFQIGGYPNSSKTMPQEFRTEKIECKHGAFCKTS